jgi:LysM repeat protein
MHSVNEHDRVPDSLRRSFLELTGFALLLVAWMSVLYGFTGLPDLARLPAWPGWDAFTAMASSRTAPLNGVLEVTIHVQWLVAIALATWLVLSVVLELLLRLIEQGPAGSSTWLRRVRAVLRRASFPLVHQVVATLFALQIVVRPPSLAFAQATPTEQTVASARTEASDGDQASTTPDAIWHTVQRGDTLWGLSERYYGNGAEFDRIIEGNVGRSLSGGRIFSRAGVIQPGDGLKIPLPSVAIEERDGQRFYVVEAGDTLSGIAARILGDPDRWLDIFTLNVGVARLGDRGPVLVDQNIIWPGLRLQLPPDETVPTAEVPSAESAPTPPPVVARFVVGEPDRHDIHFQADATPVASVSPSASETPPASETTAPTPAPVETLPPTQEPAIEPVMQMPTDSGHPVSPVAAALGAAGLAGAGLAAGRLVVYKRRSGRTPDGPESDVEIADGFAEVDPVEDLTRRVARTSGPAAAIASLWGQAYAAIFDEQLTPGQRRDTEGVTVATAKHGRTSTTLVLAAPVAARPYLVHNMRDAAERAFGSQVDVDGLVGQDGDVFIRVTWDPRRPIDGRLLELVGTSAAACAWPTPCLVPVFVPYDRQHLAINWHTIHNVLIAASTGQGADVPLTALVAALASVRAPEDLWLIVIARPHSLPSEIGRLPHGLLDVIDPANPEAVRQVLQDVKAEIDRRRHAGLTDEADLVVVVRELGDLDAEAMATADAIATTGPDYRVRLVAASERPAAELLGLCPFMDRLSTRLVLHTATEEDSVALLGMPGAEYIGAGGHGRLRVDGRMPEHGWAHRVSADKLARLVHMMGTRAPAVSPTPAPPAESSPADSAVPDGLEASETPATGDEENETGGVPAPVARIATPASEPSLLEKLHSAPIRVRCFGAREVWCGNRLLEIADSRRLQLLLLLAVHPVTGVQAELLVDALWVKPPADPAAALRGDRFDLRAELHQLVPEIGSADPVPAKQFHSDKVVAVDPRIVASDVHEFTELLRLAPTLEPVQSIAAYETALALYRGDLLDSSTVPNYRWMYDEYPQVALGLRSDFRGYHKQARMRLAELLAAGGEDGLQRAEDLYSGLCAENLGDEHLWTALFRIYERTGSPAGLESAVQRYRNAQIELGTTEVTDVDKVPLPLNLEKVVHEIRQRIGSGAAEPSSGGD